MRAFKQRLKELDRETFEQLCFHLLKERHPAMEIRRVDGQSGDQGVDHFAGDLDGRPVIWQCKHFANGIANSQKEQIRESLNTLLKHFRPAEWILCLPIDMEIKTHQWFQKLAKSKAAGVTVKLMQGSDILHELIHRKSLQDQFFPGAALETGEIRALLKRSDELSPEELEIVTAENVDQYIDRLKEHDARFNYEIRFSKDSIPAQRQPVPGLIASVSNGRHVVDVFARDLEAINRNPPQGTLTLTDTGAAKIQDLLKTGRAQHLSPDECLSFSSHFSFLSPAPAGKGFEVYVGPTRPQRESGLNLRLTFGTGPGAIVYDLVPFEIKRAGTDELELESGEGFPFRMNVIVPRDLTATVKFKVKYDPAGLSVAALKKFVSAMDVLSTPNELEFFDLKQGKQLCKFTTGGSDKVDFEQTFRTFVADLSAVAAHYGVEFTVPRSLAPEDKEALRLLVDLVHGVKYEFDSITMTLTKTAVTPPELRDALRRPGQFLYRQQEMLPRPVLFGIPVPTGVVESYIECATVKGSKAFETRFAKAAIGDSVSLSLAPCGPLSVRALGKSGTVK
jgi:hypothetical protein